MLRIASRNNNQIDLVENEGYSVRSGVYCVINPKVTIEIDDFGQYKYNLANITEKEKEELVPVCLMSDISKNESQIARDLFSGIKGIEKDKIIGYYLNLYAGFVAEGDFRENGSSGGFGTWILCELLKKGKIDGVIHVKKNASYKKDGILFKYAISRSIKSIKEGSKSHYFPVELSEVLDVVVKTPGRYAVVGIPEFITELRLLAEKNNVIKSRIVFMIGLMCGHQKSIKYAECLAWQNGIAPGELLDINFRKKRKEGLAVEYDTKFTGLVNGEKKVVTASQNELFAANWAHGFFKTKFSDFTDNPFNEAADIVLGDAWLPEYMEDSQGNNIIIVRNREIAEIIDEGINKKKVFVNSVSVDTIKKSQRGMIHHEIDELPYRLKKAGKFGRWVPKKRIAPSDDLQFWRRRAQDVRQTIAKKSKIFYKKAVKKNNFDYFKKKMSRYVRIYNYCYKMLAIKKEGYLKFLRRIVRPWTRIRQLKQILQLRTRFRNFLYKKCDGAIVTLTGDYNYGSLMQRYALQKALRKIGKKFVIYISPYEYHQKDSGRFALTSLFSKKRLFQKRFEQSDSYPIYVVGSDQVWRDWGYGDGFDGIGYFFLNFLKNNNAKRIAYAASFGKGKLTDDVIRKQNIPHIKELLKRFNHISMREKSGVDVLKNVWGESSELVLDPTLLLEVKDYEKLIKRPTSKLMPTPSINAYILDVNDCKKMLIKRIHRKIGGEIRYNFPEADDPMLPVEQWLKDFRDCEFVVTDSFHGMIFSIVFQKEFLVIANKNRGVARMSDFLKMVGLDDRIVYEDDIEKSDVLDVKEIDWRHLNERIDKLRVNSLDWLVNAIRS